jgi:carboxypeptidase D
MIRSLVSAALLLPLCSHTIRIHPLDRRHSRRDLRNNNNDNNKPMANVPVTVPQNPDDHLVTDLPLYHPNASSTIVGKHWAGHLPASADGDKYFFYWLFAPSSASMAHPNRSMNLDDVPLLIWLNGGPGCSSMDGLFLENGPFLFDTDPQTRQVRLVGNPHSWHQAPAYTLYIDQPVGTGLSFTTSGKYPSNDLQVNQDFYYFFMQFLQLHGDKFLDDVVHGDGTVAPARRVRRPVFFSGESHAGHYIPSMMHYILQQNDKADDTTSSQQSHDLSYIVTLAGAAIGNGWMDPVYQYAAAEAAYGHGMLDRAQVNAMDVMERSCQDDLRRGKYSVHACFQLLDQVVGQSHGANSPYTVSTYDARLTEIRDQARDFPPGHKIVEAYLGHWPLPDGLSMADAAAVADNKVLLALHATAAIAAGQRFQECSDPPYDALSALDGQGVVPDVIAILEHKDNVRLLFFNGMEDLICNHVGNERFLMNMQWSGQQEW